MTGPRGTVWIVDQDHWPRACLRAELIERGYDAVGFERVADAAGVLAATGHQHPQLVIIDVTGHELSDPEAIVLQQTGALLLGIGHGTGTLAPALVGATAELPWAAFLRRPIALGMIADTVDTLLKNGRGPVRADGPPSRLN